MDKEKWNEIMNKMWPKTKKELEKGIDNAKKFLETGEKHLKDFSEKSAEQTKKVSLILRREKLYYDLGKTVSKTPRTRWTKTGKIGGFIKTIKQLDQEIRKIK